MPVEGRCGTKGTSARFMRWTFYLISDPAAIRSGNNSLGMDLSNCKSLLLLWDTGYPWMTWSLIAPTAPHAKQLALICPGKGRRWCEGSKRKVGVISNLPVPRRICAASLGVACKGGCWPEMALQGHLLLQLWLLYPTPPTPAVGTGHLTQVANFTL